MTAYEMRISDWSSDVCSSDLEKGQREPRFPFGAAAAVKIYDVAAGRNVGIVVSHDDGIVSRHVRFQFLAMRSRSGVRSDGVGPAAPASCFSGLSGRRIFRLPGNAQGDHSMRWLLSKRGRLLLMTVLWAVGPVSIKSVSRIVLIHLQQFPPQAKAAILSGRPDKHNNHRRAG